MTSWFLAFKLVSIEYVPLSLPVFQISWLDPFGWKGVEVVSLSYNDGVMSDPQISLNLIYVSLWSCGPNLAAITFVKKELCFIQVTWS